jgi:chromate reductase
MKILGISGSLREASHNRRLLQVAATELPDGVSFELYSGLGDIPAYREEGDGVPTRESVGALRNKPVAVIGASTGLFGAVWAQAELRKVLATIGAKVVDAELPVGQADDAFTDDDRLADPELHKALAQIVGQLLEAAGESTEAA